MLLPVDSPVTESLIEKLKRWGYEIILSSGAPREAVPGGIDTSLSSKMKESEGRRTALKFFSNLTTSVQKIYEVFNKDGHLNLNSITEQIKSTIMMLKNYRSYILRLPSLKAEGVDYLYTHSTRTTIIALTIGNGLKLPHFRLIELGIAAVLHEIGMMKIPNHIVNKTGGLTTDEKKIIRTHPLIGLKMLQNYSREQSNPIPQEILLAISQHHERLNGSGYPQGIGNESMTLYARILAVACSYDAQISNRPFRESGESHMIIMKMLKDKHSLYDKGVITALLNSISVFALGSHVRLKNGSIGVITDIGDSPLYPIVKLYLNEDLQPYDNQPIIKTSENETKLTIAEVLRKREVQNLTTRKLLPG